MSTAGKVLCVLVALALLGAIYVDSMVSQLDRNWGKAIDAQVQKSDDLTKQVGETRLLLTQTSNSLASARAETNRELAALRSQIDLVQSQIANTRESLTRVQYQVEGQAATIETTKAAVARRDQEKAETEKSLAEAVDLVKKLDGENDALLAQLGQLRDQFLAVTRSNREMVERAGGRTTPPSAPTPAAAASFIRTAR